MPRKIDERLAQLAQRRKGTDRLDRITTASAADLIAKSVLTEEWEKRAFAQPHTRYALGAMQPVDRRYTEISIETAERVGRQLKAALPMLVSFRLQGSVPLDVHIRGVSDVDLLTLDESIVRYDSTGLMGRAGYYIAATRTSMDVLLNLRREAEKALKAAYPAATIDCSGGKCIALAGGSLARPVDVVPAHWHDTAAYQSSRQDYDRGVVILNKKIPMTLENLPFVHIRRIEDADRSVLGGMKKAIRLAKHVKNDAENQASAAQLPSFDIAALMYHANRAALRAGFTYELTILQETQRFFDWCWRNQSESRLLRTPSGDRCILDTESKISGLLTISCELDALAREVALEQVSSLRAFQPTQGQIDEALRTTFIPKAA